MQRKHPPVKYLVREDVEKMNPRKTVQCIALYCFILQTLKRNVHRINAKNRPCTCS